MTLTIAGGMVAGPGGLRRADVVAEDGRVTAVAVTGAGDRSGGPVLDARGLLVAPGYLDLQLNGALGHDLTNDPGRLWAVAAALPRFGVTAFLPTVISAPLDTYRSALAVLAAGPPPGWSGATPLGWHFEGPMLNPAHRGAHPERDLHRPDPRVYGSWSAGAGVALVTLAPELEGALDAIAALRGAGVVVAAGHTGATAHQLDLALDAGVTYLTHLFNGMAALHHRSPGPAGRALAGGPLVCGLIADGEHVDPLLVRTAWGALGPRRLNLVTDAAAPLGMPPGRYRLGGTDVTGDERGVRRADGTLAGSALPLDRAVRNLVAFTGCAAHDAIATVTATPAAVLGLRRQGRLAPGARADAVVLTPGLEVVATVVGGRIVYPPGSVPSILG